MEKLLRPNILKIEQKVVLFGVFNSMILVGINFATSESKITIFPGIILQAGNLFLLALILFFIRPTKTKYYQAFYSFFYILLFITVSYFPANVGINEHFINEEELFLLHILFLAFQSFRPGKFPGFVVILFLALHSAFLLSGMKGLTFGNVIHSYRLLVFLWMGVISLTTEIIFYKYLIRYYEMNDKNLKTEEELMMAETVHKNLFPKKIETENYKVSSVRYPANILGGDFFDLVQLREGNVGLFFTDISGHGISSAMMSAAMKVIINQMPYPYKLSPQSLFTYLDEIMYKEYTSHHASCVYLFFDFHKKEVRIGNAGHPWILYARKNEKFREIHTTGSLVGYQLRKPIVDELVLPIESGDRFFIYTDGLTEYTGMNNAKMLETSLGMEALLDGMESMESDEMLHFIVNKIRHKPDFVEFHDDVMLVAFEIL